MADAIVSIVVERLADLLIQEAISLHGVSKQVKQLQNELKLIQNLLKDADARQNENHSVRQWVADMRDVAYDAEDIIERYALKVGSRKESGGIQNVLKRFVRILREAKAIYQTSSEIGEITKRISTLSSRLQKYGIQSVLMEGGGPSSSSEKIREQRQTYGHAEYNVVGLKDSLKEVVACLTEEVKYKYRVVSICGMGGLGKTTLAGKVYNHQQVTSHFDCRAWVCISQQYRKSDVWKEVLISLISPSKEQRDEIERMGDGELVEKLCEIQRQKKCLVVLDDIWKVGAWYNLRAAFPTNDTNSRILLTSRNEALASKVDPSGHIHKLPFLNDEESWELFQYLALSRRSEECTIKENMKILGKEMVRYCKGLPLAITVLGGLLGSQQTLEEWNQVHRNVKSYIHQQDGLPIHEQDGLPISIVLGLSYDDLPSHLKLCFLYLGHFPEDFEIRRTMLIQMWVAEGLVYRMQHIGSNEETLEDVGERYLQELVQRCMVQVGQKSSFARIKTCRLHDLMRGFCVEKAKSENFLHLINIDHESNEEREAPIGEVRRVAISGGSSPMRHGFTLPSTSQKYFHLRSLLTFSVPLKEQSMLRNFKYLRVLNFVMTGRMGMDCPPEIESLIHLRFLSLRDTSIRSIPSLRNLKCLQTLDLRSRWNSVILPNDVFRNMEHLRHLYLPPDSRTGGKLQLPNASKLQTLVNIPVSICDVKDPTAGFDEFGKELMPSNVTFNCLHVLKIYVGSLDKKVAITPMVMSCPRIYQLRLVGKIEKLPEHDKISQHLAHLKLETTQLEEDPMLILEKLSNLKILHLADQAYTGNKMICSVRGFPQLQSLILTHLDWLEEWEVEEGSMPMLCHLKIDFCFNLRMVPDGLQFVGNLRKLEIVSMESSFKKRLGEGGEDFYKIRHVPSVELTHQSPSRARNYRDSNFSGSDSKIWFRVNPGG
ncbi:hypothetical protein I3842_01G087700 [Carya illinoinensis]|uniref:Disease resistance protein At1g50180 n=1 Tax=Carya illinoinensis TaxID=32201 RepID=A0A922K3G9_CARIL|nr:hypothetical protein I3842_01G087700 [Carya illinoinensis]KAG6730582.1 hypothetical protein I3842_01G087700 [Carya illinoinensis]KAG6730583.1 hypothetical protein I3842_01G087700 [Carya illinoinensis]